MTLEVVEVPIDPSLDLSGSYIERAVKFHDARLGLLMKVLERTGADGIEAGRLFSLVRSGLSEEYRWEVFESDLGALMRAHVVDISDGSVSLAA